VAKPRQCASGLRGVPEVGPDFQFPATCTEVNTEGPTSCIMEGMPKAGLRWFPLLLPAIAAMVMGCGGYNSNYVPPADGRPRLVWQDNKVVPMSANAIPAQCSSETDALLGGSGSVPVSRYVGGGGGGGVRFWVPVRTVAVVRVNGPIIAPIPRLGGSFSGGGLGKLGGGGGGGGGDIGKAAIVVAVLAIAVLPFIALGLAAGRPEPEDQVAAAIDQVNAQTDLARVPGSACDELVVAGGGQ
jgi:hypothetical protein